MISSRIHCLPAHVANQIAAGEVIERPASVVKELLENARDAGATQITIEIECGGLTYLSVSDNGVGIDPDDLMLAITPHATSKLKDIHDLYALQTLGFRGEALASIASVSRLSLSSRPLTESCAHILEYDGFEWQRHHRARPVGTTVVVRDLFYNMPVRKQFLKSPAQEAACIELLVKQFSCIEPKMGITLYQEGKKKFDCLPAKDEQMWRARLRLIFGKAFESRVIHVELKEDEMTFSAWMAHPDDAKNQYDKQWCFINQRMIRDRQLLRLFKIAYEPYVIPGRAPNGLFYLTVPSLQLDVNIHPMKQEVRFLEERKVYDFVYAAISSTLRDQIESKQEDQKKVAPSLSSIHPFSPGWTVLNSDYACLRYQSIMYLVHVKEMRRKAQLSRWKKMPLPWPAREFLVPVQVHLEDIAEFLDGFLPYEPLLRTMGFDWKVSQETGFWVKSIPIECPNLELGMAFSCLKMFSSDLVSLQNWLLHADAWNLEILLSEEHAHWQSYWQDAFTKGEADDYTKPLTKTLCDHWFLK